MLDACYPLSKGSRTELQRSCLASTRHNRIVSLPTCNALAGCKGFGRSRSFNGCMLARAHYSSSAPPTYVKGQLPKADTGNTSGLRLNAVAQYCSAPGRMLNLHIYVWPQAPTGPPPPTPPRSPSRTTTRCEDVLLVHRLPGTRQPRLLRSRERTQRSPFTVSASTHLAGCLPRRIASKTVDEGAAYGPR